MIKIQEIIEEALGGVRTELGKMEAVVGTTYFFHLSLSAILT